MNRKNYLKPELLVISKRADSIETMHYGWVCILNKDKKILFKKGNINDKVFLRSIAKPIQAIPVSEDVGELTNEELAIICSSHSGSHKHIKILNKILKKFNAKISDLRCGIHLPFDENEKKRLIKNNLKPSLLHNNCSGKHLGMILVCKKNNWSLRTYLSPMHHLQRRILNNIENLSETQNISLAIDGCGAPTYAMPVVNVAKLFSNFSLLKNKNYIKIINAMHKHPYIVGGSNYVDSEIMKRIGVRLISKVGGDGIIMAAYDGTSIIVKIADGTSRARSLVMIKLLVEFGYLTKNELKDSFLQEILNGHIKNHAGKIVGQITTVF